MINSLVDAISDLDKAVNDQIAAAIAKLEKAIDAVPDSSLLRASHDRLFRAAKEAIDVFDPWPRIDGHHVARCLDRLQDAINKADGV